MRAPERSERSFLRNSSIVMRMRRTRLCRNDCGRGWLMSRLSAQALRAARFRCLVGGVVVMILFWSKLRDSTLEYLFFGHRLRLDPVQKLCEYRFNVLPDIACDDDVKEIISG